MSNSTPLMNLFNMLELARVRTDNPELQVAVLQILLEVAKRPETPMADLETAVGFSQAAVSRNVKKLGKGSTSERGAGLVDAYEDPEYGRRKLVKLTPRGKKLIDDMLEIL